MQATAILEKDFVLGQTEDALFGSFIEHLGRSVYTGIYEPGHPTADEQGFRKDVLALVRDLRIALVRYPGGNFLSGYNWRDGIGPRERRPVRLDRAWHTIETNQVGIDDFCDWARKAGAEVMGAVNLGTGTPQDAADLVEYCNHPGGTEWSDLRIRNGHREPHRIRHWCVGNEMDGDWQICHLEAAEYGRKARETIKLMRWTDESIRVSVCGSASPNMPTFPEWDRIVLEHTYGLADYLSIHQYFENQGDDDDFLASFAEMDRFIRIAAATCDYVKALTRSKKTMALSFDEWNVWYQSRQAPHPWEQAPRLLEDRYSLLDALAFGGMAITLLNHADRVKAACLAQLVNVIAPIVTEPGKGAFRQTIYHPFRDVSVYGRGTVLTPVVRSPLKHTRSRGDVPAVVFAAVHDEGADTVTVFALNTDRAEAADTTLDLGSFGETRMTMRTELAGPDLSAVNSLEAPDAVSPTDVPVSQGEHGRYVVRLKPASWNVFRFAGR